MFFRSPGYHRDRKDRLRQSARRSAIIISTDNRIIIGLRDDRSISKFHPLFGSGLPQNRNRNRTPNLNLLRCTQRLTPDLLETEFVLPAPPSRRFPSPFSPCVSVRIPVAATDTVCNTGPSEIIDIHPTICPFLLRSQALKLLTKWLGLPVKQQSGKKQGVARDVLALSQTTPESDRFTPPPPPNGTVGFTCL
ncbi:hypothetical protein BDV12DRAFT_58288 [Aspergillus spectabilis]